MTMQQKNHDQNRKQPMDTQKQQFPSEHQAQKPAVNSTPEFEKDRKPQDQPDERKRDKANPNGKRDSDSNR